MSPGRRMLRGVVRRAARCLPAAVGVLLLGVLGGCAALPSLAGRDETHALMAPPDSPMRAAVDPMADVHPGAAGIRSLGNSQEAFAARILLIQKATSSLDVQYYILHDDITGRLLLDALCRAADRGVRVRLLLDDNNTKGMDHTLAALAAHRNVELRLFNPFVHRSFRSLDFMTDFSRLNRRMHNKSLTADGVMTIIGGRNIGDEYYGAGEEFEFVDLDVLAIGPVVQDVARSFDAYWNSDSAYPAGLLLKPASPADVARLENLGVATMQAPAAEQFVAAVRDSPLLSELLVGRLALEWASARFVVDDPLKALGLAPQSDLFLGRLEAALDRRIANELTIVSPYFVPQKEGSATLVAMAQRGVHVRVLTNSLEATDVAAVHAGYARRRMTLLRGGVELLELRRGTDEPKKSTHGAASSGASLHAKTFEADAQQIFVGSFNFDPRSATLNTEDGLIIDSPPLASRLQRAIDGAIGRAAYKVQLDGSGHLEWVETTPAGTVKYSKEPHVGLLRRMFVGFLRILPIEPML